MKKEICVAKFDDTRQKPMSKLQDYAPQKTMPRLVTGRTQGQDLLSVTHTKPVPQEPQFLLEAETK